MQVGTFNAGVKNGTVDTEKLQAIELAWRKWVQAKYKPPDSSSWETLAVVDVKVEESVTIPKLDDNLKLKDDAAAYFEKRGFTIGKAVKLSKYRVTGSYMSGTEQKRKDVVVKKVGTIVGIDDGVTDMLWASFPIQAGQHVFDVKAHVKFDNVQLVAAAPSADDGAEEDIEEAPFFNEDLWCVM